MFAASIAITLRPGCSAAATSTSTAVRHESVTRGDAANCWPLTYSVKPSSAVARKFAAETWSPAGRSNARRKYRVAAGAELAGSPSGYQTQFAPVSDGRTGVACPPIQDPWNSLGVRNAVSNDARSLHCDAAPVAFQTRTRQK